jgi:hypothetical protein
MSGETELWVKEQPCDLIANKEIIHIGVDLKGLNGGFMVNVPINDDYLNMPTPTLL